MKRSDLFKLIDQEVNLDDWEINRIIDVIINAGMLPPSTYIKTFDKYDNVWDNEEDENKT